jgi:hypothetical protein
MVKKIYTHNFFINCLERDDATLDQSKELPDHLNSNVSCPYLCKCGRPHSKRLERIHKDGAVCIECGGSKKVYDKFALLRHCREKDIELVDVPSEVTHKTVVKGHCKGDNCNNIWEKGFACLTDPKPYSGPYCMGCSRSKQANVFRTSVSTDTTKRCSECKIFKDKECFGNANNTWDGLSVCCNDCTKNRQDSLKAEGYYRDYHRERRKVDENFAMAAKLRGRLRTITKCVGNCEKTKDLVGISKWEHVVEYLKLKSPVYDPSHLKMDIDHIIPVNVFNFMDPHHVIACFHYSNLQYLSPSENQNLKKAKLPPNFDFDTWLAKQLIQIVRIENEKLSCEDVLQLQKEGVFQGYITDEMKWW